MILVFFPLAFPADEHLLHAVFPGIIWISLLFALFLASERLFQDEEQDGVLEQWLLDPERVLTRLYAKLTVHWLVNILPMLLFVPGVVILFNLPLASALSLALAIVAGTPSLFLFCALAAALSSGVRQQSMFMALIILPLTLPILILGSGVLTASLHSMPISGLLALLTALSLFAGLILPKVIALVIRLQVS
jgi:heme exporter protein B